MRRIMLLGTAALVMTAMMAAMAAGLLTLALLAKPTQAQGVEVNERIPFEFSGQPICGGEEVVFQDTMHALLNITEDESGGVHVIGHTNLEQMRGTGLESGDRYVVSEIHNTLVNNNNLVFTEVLHGRLVNTGEDGTHTDDTLFHVTFHIEGGQVTADNFVFHCD